MLLPFRDFEDRTLYIRIAAYGMIGAASFDDDTLLSRLSNHYYGLVGKAAAMRLAEVLGGQALRVLTYRKTSLREGEAEDLAAALRSTELEHYGLGHLA